MKKSNLESLTFCSLIEQQPQKNTCLRINTTVTSKSSVVQWSYLTDKLRVDTRCIRQLLLI